MREDFLQTVYIARQGIRIGASIGYISDSLTHHCISIQPVGLYSWIFIQPGDLYSTGYLYSLVIYTGGGEGVLA